MLAAEHAHPRLGKTFAGLLVLHQLQRTQHADAAGLAHQRMLGQLLPARLQIGCRFRFDSLDDLLLAQDANVLQRHRRGDRVSRVGEAVVELAALVERLHHLIAHHHAAHGQVAGGHALGDGHQVRCVAVVVAAEPFAGAAEAADDFVGDEEDVVTRENLADLRPVAGWRNDHAAGPLDRLGDKGRHLVLADFENLLLQLLRDAHAEFFRTQRTAFAEPVGLVDMLDAGNRTVALAVHGFHAAQAGAGHRRAVVAVPAADDHFLPRHALGRPVMAHHAQYRVIGFRAGAGEEHVIHARWRDVGDGLGQRDGRWMGRLEEEVVVGQLAHLPGSGLDQLLASIADVDAPESGHRIENLVALAIPQVDAGSLGDHPRALGIERLVVGEWRQMVIAAQGLPLQGLRIAHGHLVQNGFMVPATASTPSPQPSPTREEGAAAVWFSAALHQTDSRWIKRHPPYDCFTPTTSGIPAPRS